MSKRCCTGCLVFLGLSAGVAALAFVAFMHALRTYQDVEEYPSPTGNGSLLNVLSQDGLSDWHNVTFVANPRHQQGEPYKIIYQPMYGFHTLQWSGDGSVIVLDDRYLYDFRTHRGIDASVLPAKKRFARFEQKLKTLMQQRGGEGKRINQDYDIEDERIQPRSRTIWLWEQRAWQQRDRR